MFAMQPLPQRISRKLLNTSHLATQDGRVGEIHRETAAPAKTRPEAQSPARYLRLGGLRPRLAREPPYTVANSKQAAKDGERDVDGFGDNVNVRNVIRTTVAVSGCSFGVTRAHGQPLLDLETAV